MKNLLLLWVVSMMVLSINAQQTDERVANLELEKLGITQDELTARLATKGINLASITDPDQLLQFESIIQETILELQREKGTQILDTIPLEPVILIDTVPQVRRDSIPQFQEVDRPQTNQEDIYGHHLFRYTELSASNENLDIKAPDSYILGAADELLVSIWGASQADLLLTIDRSGFVKPSRIPRIYLKGLTMANAKNLLRSRLSRYYSFNTDEFDISLRSARTLSVNILGEVSSPGMYHLSSMNSIISAIAAASGPTEIGSLREIKLIHSDGSSEEIDLYQYLVDPVNNITINLLEGDNIFLPVSRYLVSIAGAIKRPMKYELKENESLSALILYAGGLEDNALLSSIQVRRYENDREIVLDVDWADLQEKRQVFSLRNGDSITVRTIPQVLRDYVTIDGAVEIKGDFELESNMRISDLVKKGILLPEAALEIALLTRIRNDNSFNYLWLDLSNIELDTSSSQNIELQARDRVRIFSQTRFIDSLTVEIGGAVRDPVAVRYDPGETLKLSDAIFLAGGLNSDATNFGYVLRQQPGKEESLEYIRVDLDEALNSPGTEADLVLKGNDRIVVYSRLSYVDETFVNVSGAIRSPGRYQYGPGLTLQDVITMAGGLTLEAARNRIQIYRISINEKVGTETVNFTIEIDDENQVVGNDNFSLDPFDEIVVRRLPEFEFQRSITIDGEVTFPGEYALLEQNERLGQIIERAGKVTREAFLEGATLFRSSGGVGYVVMKLDEILRDQNSPFNYIMKDGDLIFIPKQNDVVTVTGATRYDELYEKQVVETGKISVAFQAGKNARHYVEEYAGGIGQNGRAGLITVEHPNGEVEKTRGFLLFKKYPPVRNGTIITVGTKRTREPRDRGDKEEVDWGQTIATTIAQATGILSLILLIQQVNK